MSACHAAGLILVDTSQMVANYPVTAYGLALMDSPTKAKTLLKRALSSAFYRQKPKLEGWK